MELQWPLILFTTFVAWSTGVFASQGIVALRNEAPKSQMPALVTSVALMAIGGIAVFFHLEHWERIFNGFGHLNSGITQELICIVLFMAVAVAYFIMLRKSEDGSVPTWTAVAAIVVSALTMVATGHSYLMAARPAWDTVLEIACLLGNMAAAGSLTMMLLAAAKGGCPKTGAVWAVAASIANAVTTVAYVAFCSASGGSLADVGYYFDPTRPTEALADVTAETAVLTGELAPLVWLGVLGLGCAVPIVMALLGWKKGDSKAWRAFAGVGALCAVVGAVCMRVVFYEVGLSVFMFY